MNILFVVPYPPSLVRSRSYNFIRSLTGNGHAVTVLTLWSSPEEQAEIDDFRQYCHEVIALPMPRWRSMANSLLALPTPNPLQSVYSWLPALAYKLAELAASRRYDAAHIEHLRGSRYGLHMLQLRSRQNLAMPVVWDSVDCISLLFRLASTRSKNMVSRMITRLEVGRTARMESELPLRFDHTTVTSPIDKKALLDLCARPGKPDPAMSLVPNGVDLEYFNPGDPAERTHDTLVVTGKMSYHANVTMVTHLAQEIMPRVWAKRPDVKLQIIGRDPSSEVRALDAHPNVSVLGGVPNFTPYLHRAALALAPLQYGVGIQNKVIEAMSTATPVVASPQAVSALQITPGQEVAVADGADEYARTVLDLLELPEARHRMGQAGRGYVEKYHRWSALAERLAEIYQHGAAA